MNKLIPKSRLVSAKPKNLVKNFRFDASSDIKDLLYQAQRCWDNMLQFRLERERNKNYTYGKQWEDIVDVDGKLMSEEDYILSQGSVPLKNNLIRRLVRNVMGVFRSQDKEPTCTARDRDEQRLGETMSTVLQCNWQMNRMNEVNGRTMEEFLISGAAIQKKSWDWRRNKFDEWTDLVNPNEWFVDGNMRDPRHWDCSFIGEIHDISFNDLCLTFAHSSSETEELKSIYHEASDRKWWSDNMEQFGHRRLKNLDFLCPNDTNLCRVIEIWAKEQKPRYRCHDYLNGEYFKIDIQDKRTMVDSVNEERRKQAQSEGMKEEDIPLVECEWFEDSYWYYRFLTPFGQVLQEGETPFAHGEHPYVFKLYPFIDGEIHSFVGDVIDQQRYVNRLITQYDWIMRASAKGLLIFPEECLPDDKSLEDIADEWHRANGFIAIKTKGLASGVMPQQIAQNATNIGISELLNIELKFFEDISGVNGALQGKPGYSGTSASKYQQETQNATTSLLDLLESFSSFIIEGAIKDVKNMQQFYDSKRVFNIVGKSSEQIEYDPEKIRDVEFDLSVVESQSTPVYRMMCNDFLMQIWQANQISLEQLLENGSFPFADELLQSIKSQKEQMEQGQPVQPLSPQLQQQVQQGANMQAVNQGYQALKK